MSGGPKPAPVSTENPRVPLGGRSCTESASLRPRQLPTTPLSCGKALGLSRWEITRVYQRDQSSPSTRLRPSAQRAILLNVETQKAKTEISWRSRKPGSPSLTGHSISGGAGCVIKKISRSFRTDAAGVVYLCLFGKPPRPSATPPCCDARRGIVLLSSYAKPQAARSSN